MTICKGSRVFMKDSQKFGTVFRTGVLGLKSGAYVVIDDDGKNIVYTGEKAKHDVICCEDCKNNCGETYELPLDIYDIYELSAPIMERNEVSKLKQMKIKSNMLKLEDEQKKEFKSKWELTGKNEKKKLKLIMTLV